MKIVVKSSQFIFGGNTRKMQLQDLFKKVEFPRKKDYFEVTAATWTHKIIYNNEPEMIIYYIRHPTYREACKVAPRIKLRSTSFKRTAIASRSYSYNKLNIDTVSLNPRKCKALIQIMEHFGAVPKISELNKVLKAPNDKNSKN